jgi:hypothetical protein
MLDTWPLHERLDNSARGVRRLHAYHEGLVERLSEFTR